MGIKVDLTNKKPTNDSKNKSTTNKSMFEFNDTFVDSIIQSQKEPKQQVKEETCSQKLPNKLSQNSNLLNEIRSLEGLCLDATLPTQITGLSACRTNTQKTSLLNEINSLAGLDLETQTLPGANYNQPQILVDDSLNESANRSTDYLNAGKQSNTGQKDTSSTGGILVDDSLNETARSPGSLNSSKVNKTSRASCSNSFWDDQFMLEAVKLFEKVDGSKKSVAEKGDRVLARRPLEETRRHMNTTSVSQDIIEMCQMFENKGNLQSAKKVEKKADKENGQERVETASRRRRSSAKFRILFGSDEEASEETVDTVEGLLIFIS
jgi:hypothetical protein